jgi:hypothetical protein
MSTAVFSRGVLIAQAEAEIAAWGDSPDYWRHMIDVAIGNGHPGAAEVYREAVVLTERIDRLAEDEVSMDELEDAEWIETQVQAQQ